MTNTARYVVRPVGPALAGVSQSIASVLPFVMAGGIKSLYDLVPVALVPRRAVPDDTREPESRLDDPSPDTHRRRGGNP